MSETYNRKSRRKFANKTHNKAREQHFWSVFRAELCVYSANLNKLSTVFVCVASKLIAYATPLTCVSFFEFVETTHDKTR